MPNQNTTEVLSTCFKSVGVCFILLSFVEMVVFNGVRVFCLFRAVAVQSTVNQCCCCQQTTQCHGAITIVLPKLGQNVMDAQRTCLKSVGVCFLLLSFVEMVVFNGVMVFCLFRAVAVQSTVNQCCCCQQTTQCHGAITRFGWCSQTIGFACILHGRLELIGRGIWIQLRIRFFKQFVFAKTTPATRTLVARTTVACAWQSATWAGQLTS